MAIKLARHAIMRVIFSSARNQLAVHSPRVRRNARGTDKVIAMVATQVSTGHLHGHRGFGVARRDGVAIWIPGTEPFRLRKSEHLIL